MIAAPRAAVWAAASDDNEDCDPTWHQHIVGAPDSGVGAKHIHVGPPLPPFGMRSVIYTEITALHEGYWYTSQTLAGSWEHTETLMLENTADGQTLARISGWWTKPAPPTSDFTALQAGLNGLATQMLDRIAVRVEGTSGHGPSDVVG
ncbi:MAG: hypothetical protein HGA44_22255 [Cellulomonadaceae bacterium]|nr:hypothetical protein [Cellulomonadaceae bacterium]